MTSPGEGPRPAAGGFSRDRAAGVGLLAFGLLILWQARALSFGSFGEPGAGMFPTILAILLVVVGVALAVAGGGPALRALGWAEAPRGLAIFAALAFAALALEPLGYRLTVAAVMLFLVGAVERKGWVPALLVALGFAFGTYALFADALRVPLPRGPFGV